MNPFVKVRVEQTLRKFLITSAPVDPTEVAERLGLTVRKEFFEGDLSGVLMRKNGVGVIAVNANDAQVRQRFTIAHELGHFILDHKGDLFVDHTIMNRRDARSSTAIDPQEIDANAFAAELLMPERIVENEVYQLLHSGDQVDSVSILKLLAAKFQVSEQAMTYRLMNLGILA